MKKIAYIFIILLSISSIAYATNWVNVNDNLYIDTDSIEYYIDSYGKKDYDKISFWTQSINNNSESWKKIENSLKKTGEKRKPSYSNDRLIIDCKQKSIAVKACSMYADNGESIYSYDKNYLEWNSIVPNSTGENFYNNICIPTKVKRGVLKFFLGGL